MSRLLRWIWALPATAIGLAVAACAFCLGARPRLADGVIEVCGRPARARGRRRGARIDAITFGHVVIGRSDAALERLRTHERAHVRQYERWGVFLLPAYLLSSLWQLLQGRHPYYHNAFEVEAFREAAAARDRTPALGRAPCGQDDEF